MPFNLGVSLIRANYLPFARSPFCRRSRKSRAGVSAHVFPSIKIRQKNLQIPFAIGLFYAIICS